MRRAIKNAPEGHWSRSPLGLVEPATLAGFVSLAGSPPYPLLHVGGGKWFWFDGRKSMCPNPLDLCGYLTKKGNAIMSQWLTASKVSTIRTP